MERKMERELDLRQDHRLRYLQKYMGLSEEEGKELIEVLTSPAPRESDEYGAWVKERPIRGGGSVKYIPGFRFIQRFNEAFGFLWSYEVLDSFERDDQIVVKGRWSLQVPGRTIEREYTDGTKEILRFEGFEIRKEQYGSSEVKRFSKDIKNKQGEVTYKKGDIIDLGDDYKGAGTDAMKKCGTQLGLFMDIYGPREGEEEKGPSESQLEAFYKRALDVGKDKEEAVKWAEEQIGKPIDKLGKDELLGLTADLIQMKREQG